MQKSRLCAQKKKPDKPVVALDTNIFVSAFLSPEGPAAQIVSLIWRGKLQACYNQAMLDEYSEVLSRSRFRFKISQSDIQEVVETIKRDGLFYDVQPSAFLMRDETDRVFYDTAKAAKASLVTGNKKHYPDEPFILTPREFLDTLDTPDQSNNTDSVLSSRS